MKKLGLKVSGSRVGEDTRPSASRAEMIGPRQAPRFGLRVHGARPEIVDLAPALKTSVITPISPDDYATADDYE